MGKKPLSSDLQLHNIAYMVPIVSETVIKFENIIVNEDNVFSFIVIFR